MNYLKIIYLTFPAALPSRTIPNLRPPPPPPFDRPPLDEACPEDADEAEFPWVPEEVVSDSSSFILYLTFNDKITPSLSKQLILLWRSLFFDWTGIHMKKAVKNIVTKLIQTNVFKPLTHYGVLCC